MNRPIHIAPRESWSHERIREEHYSPLARLIMAVVWLVVCGYALKLAVVG
jgi:hypothetical protein